MTPADSGARARLDAAFARQERRGLMLAAGARSVAVLVIVVWVALTNPERGLAHAWVLGTALLFAVTGVVQFWLYARDLAPALAPYLFALVDSLLLAAVFVVPNPFAPAPLPPAIPLRYGNFVFFFILLMQMAFSFRPRLLLWTGLCGAVAWTLAFLWVVTRPGVTTGTGPGLDLPSGLTTYLDPNFVSVLKYEGEIIAFLVVAAGLALLVRRSRILVAERAEAERERSNLARYFSPKVVDELAERDEPLGRVRRQAVGVLFADLVGFTTLAEDMTPEEVMAMLRAFHGRMEEEVFRHGGCLEKFIGDALLATFGVPDVGHARRHRHAGLRARDAGGAGRVEPRARRAGIAAATHGHRPALRPGRARRHRQPAQHGLRDGRRHRERHQPPADADPRPRRHHRGQHRADRRPSSARRPSARCWAG